MVLQLRVSLDELASLVFGIAFASFFLGWLLYCRKQGWSTRTIIAGHVAFGWIAGCVIALTTQEWAYAVVYGSVATVLAPFFYWRWGHTT